MNRPGLLAIIGIPLVIMLLWLSDRRPTVTTTAQTSSEAAKPVASKSPDEEVLQICMQLLRERGAGLMEAYHKCKDAAANAEVTGLPRCLYVLVDGSGMGVFQAMDWCKSIDPAGYHSAGRPSPATTAPPPSPATAAPSPPPNMYQKGLIDRTAWENWIASLTDDYKKGAEYWAAQRSLSHPGLCSGVPDFTAGCAEAKERLSPADALRKTEPEYKRGWNSYKTPTPPG